MRLTIFENLNRFLLEFVSSIVNNCCNFQCFKNCNCDLNYFLLSVNDVIYILFIVFFFSFTLYLAHSRLGRGNLVLRHFVTHFLPNCVLTELNAAPSERRNENINLRKYFISSSGDRINKQSILQSHFVPLRHDWPQFLYSSLLILHL